LVGPVQLVLGAIKKVRDDNPYCPLVWGHDHDFGNGVFLRGGMSDRHIVMLSTMVDQLQLPLNLSGSKILDIGSWTGGTSLLLSFMGADVTGVDIVKPAVEAANVLVRSYNLENIRFVQQNIMDYLRRDDIPQFDVINCLGVIYLVKHPLMLLELMMAALKPGGALFINSHLIPKRPDGPYCVYAGSSLKFEPDPRVEGSRHHYFVPSVDCLEAWCEDVGFTDIRSTTQPHFSFVRALKP
jgi:SAM-dependent methyltransferase